MWKRTLNKKLPALKLLHSITKSRNTLSGIKKLCLASLEAIYFFLFCSKNIFGSTEFIHYFTLMQ